MDKKTIKANEPIKNVIPAHSDHDPKQERITTPGTIVRTHQECPSCKQDSMVLYGSCGTPYSNPSSDEIRYRPYYEGDSKVGVAQFLQWRCECGHIDKKYFGLYCAGPNDTRPKNFDKVHAINMEQIEKAEEYIVKSCQQYSHPVYNKIYED